MGDQSSSKNSVPALILVAFALASSALFFLPGRDEAATATTATSGPSTESQISPTASPSPVDKIDAMLRAQAQALLNGDEAGWLSPVDAKLKGKYKTLYRNLRELDVTYAEQRLADLPDEKGTALTGQVRFGYCFSGADCTSWKDSVTEGAPKLTYKLTWTPRGDSWTITEMVGSGVANYLQPAPWENNALTFAHGKRVIVAAPAGQAKYVKRVLPLAEKAAVVTDRYAGFAGKPQNMYRVYIADDKSWKKWYQGVRPAYSVAYNLALNAKGSDTVLKSSEVMDYTNKELTQVIQHEFAHAFTLQAGTNFDAGDDLWLSEGIAEYIGYLPEKPQNSYSADVLRYVRDRRGTAKTIAVKPLTDKSDEITVANLYATGHFAAGCMADKYGEPKMLDFVDRVLQYGEQIDPASRAAFGKPFKTVDKACVAWIKQKI